MNALWLTFYRRVKMGYKENLAPYTLLLLAFVGIHAIFYGFGGRFDILTSDFWQMVDPGWLQERYWECLWYLHIQPPLFNAYLGFVRSIPLVNVTWIFWMTYLFLGLTGIFALYHTLQGFHVSPGIAVGVTIFSLISPSWVMYEHWLFYSFPTMIFLSLSIYGMQRYFRSPTWGNCLFVCTLLFLLFLIRSIFHWLWCGLALVIMWKGVSANWKPLLKGAAVPALLLFAFLIKNYALFGMLSTSSWMGPNLLMMTKYIPYSVRDGLYLKGKFSPYVAVGSFAPLDEYEKWNRQVAEKKWGIEILDRRTKENGIVNYNHGAYLTINHCQLQDALVMVTHSTRYYWKQVKESWRRFCYPCWINEFFYGQPQSMNYYLAGFNYLFLGWRMEEAQRNFEEMRVLPKKTLVYWFLPALLGSTFIFICLPRRFSLLSSSDRSILVFCLITTGLIIFSGTFLLASENNRVRFLLTPLITIYLGLLIDRLWRGWNWFLTEKG